MASTRGSTDAEHQIATIRCLLAQQIQTIQRQERNAPERRAADALLRELLRRDEDLRRRLAGGAGEPPLP